MYFFLNKLSSVRSEVMHISGWPSPTPRALFLRRWQPRKHVPTVDRWFPTQWACNGESVPMSWHPDETSKRLPLQWRHNGRDGVSNHQPHDWSYNRLFGRRSKKTSRSASLAFVRGIHRGPVNSPHKWPVTRKKVSIWSRHHGITDIMAPNNNKTSTHHPTNNITVTS